uniref:Metalloendopeptidase n=1 Tax=Lepeophtheirus salmonis TaxID=72036 RepID=A0A0K2UDH9_LEPSM
MDHIESQTCLKFVQIDHSSKKNTLMINGDYDCSASGGYIDQTTEYWAATLSFNITRCMQFGTIVHELMHVLGSLHEQSRPDRNTFIQMEWNNIQKWGRNQFYRYRKLGETCTACPETTEQNLTVQNIKELNSCCDKSKAVSEFGGYDYGSIMHYKIKNG